MVTLMANSINGLETIALNVQIQDMFLFIPFYSKINAMRRFVIMPQKQLTGTPKVFGIPIA
jgi:hypothetical protein